MKENLIHIQARNESKGKTPLSYVTLIDEANHHSLKQE